MYYKTWMEKQLSLYAVWDCFVRDINLHVSLIHIGNPLDDFNHTYMPHLDSHPDDPSILEALLRRVYEASGPPTLCVMLWILLPMITTCPFRDVVWMKT